MQVNYTLNFNHMLKKTVVLGLMIGVVVLATASSGGGDKKKSGALGMAYLKKNSGFSLKAGRNYSNSLSLPVNTPVISLTNSVLTYRKGNTFYIMPTQHNLRPTVKTNLNLLNLKINLHH